MIDVLRINLGDIVDGTMMQFHESLSIIGARERARIESEAHVEALRARGAIDDTTGRSLLMWAEDRIQRWTP